MKDIATTLPIREGVNHIVISRLFDLKESSVHHDIGNFECETYPIAKSR